MKRHVSGITRRIKTGMVSVIKGFSAALLPLIVGGCAVLSGGMAGQEAENKFQEAAAHYDKGNYKAAHDAYRAVVEKHPESSLAEQSGYNAAHILVYHKNAETDYAQALREFDEFLKKYPSSAFNDDAASWLKILKIFDESTANELIRNVASLTKTLDESRARLQEIQTMRDAVLKERDALSIEKTGFIKRVDELLNEKDALLKDKAALLKDKDGLIKERAALEKKADALAKDKENLTSANEKLVKSLHDLTMVDVKMEKKRKRIK